MFNQTADGLELANLLQKAANLREQGGGGVSIVFYLNQNKTHCGWPLKK